MKNEFDGIISRLDITKERISELEDLSIESLNQKNQKKQQKNGEKQKKKYPRTVGIPTKGVTYVQWEYEKERKE